MASLICLYSTADKLMYRMIGLAFDKLLDQGTDILDSSHLIYAH
jgi:hypothetical protein